LLLLATATLAAAPPDKIVQLAREVRVSSFPDLDGVRIQFRSLRSSSDYFRSLPAVRGYFILISDNPVLDTAPPEAIKAILAHEFEHICWYRSRSRWKLAGLVRLLKTSYQRRWETDTDFRTIRRGYGTGLRDYRLWLYRHVAPAVAVRKKRIYLTPDEITAALEGQTN
jgi:hypothetical protein